MKETTSELHINGRRYDAVSGALLGDAPVSIPVQKVQTAKPRVHHGRNIDGIVRAPAAKTKRTPVAAKVVHHTPTITTTRTTAPRPKVANHALKPRRTPAPHLQHHKTQKSKILMRSAVPKPHIVTPIHVKSVVPHVSHAQLAVDSKIEVKRSIHQVDPSREAHAKTTPKHEAVTRYGNNVKFAPKAPTITKQQPVAAPRHVTTAKEDNIFEQAIAHANAHQNTYTKPKRGFFASHHRKTAGVAMAAFVLLTTAGFVGYSNMPQIELQIASVQAGIRANVPDYTPTGFAKAGPVKYGDGTIAMSFVNPNQNRSYQLTQTASDLSSKEVLETMVAVTERPYQEIQVQGKSVYIYNNAQAAWVNGGTLYEIKGDALLGNDQIIAIASSM